MKKFTKTLLVFFLSMLGTANVFAADQLVDLEAEMFKAWSSNEPGATVVAEPDPEPKSNNPFGCEYNLFKQVDAYGTIFGSPNVYCMWYADITGTKEMTVTGTPGMKIRVMMNRVPYVEGGSGDADGGDYVELVQTIGDEGTTVFDLTSYEYIHLNAIKVPGGGPGGIVKAIQLYGSVKAVSGWVDLLNNGDLEGTDLESFPVSKDGVNVGTANFRPEIVVVDDQRVMKVVADDLTAIDEGWTTWSTQFFLKLSEPLEAGAQYRMTLDIKASENATISTSAQGEPRAWHSGFIDNFDVSDLEWKQLDLEGTVTADQGKEGGLISIAFDLNQSNKPITFYFKNAHFYTYKEKNALSQFKAGFQNDVICIDLGENTNMKELIAATGGKRVIFPTNCASVKVNGNPSTLFSVEGKEDNKLYVFIEDNYAEDENAKVEVSFTNPADAACHLKFIAGKYEGEDVPNFADMLCEFQDGLGESYTYLADIPEVEYINPENGSFNLPLGMREFKVKFRSNAQAAKLKATLGSESLAVSPAEGLSQEFTLTRTGEGDLAAGEYVLSITDVYPESDILGDEQKGNYSVTLNFGPVVVDPNDVEKEIIPASYFANCSGGGIPEGFLVNFNGEERTNTSGYSSGSRMMDFGAGGDFTKGLYFREGFTQYGSFEDHFVTLEANKKYKIHFNSAQWKDNGVWMKFEIISNETGEAVFSQMIENKPNVNGSTAAVNGSTVTDINFFPEASGDYLLKWTSTDANGNQGWNEVLLANVWMKYMPNTVGAEETQLLAAALENAYTVFNNNSEPRYAGADLTTLDELIDKIEAEKATYTAPSVYREAAEALDAACEAVKNHRQACDTYDANIKKSLDIVRQVSAEEDNGKPNEKRKFMNTEQYTELCNIVEAYHGSSQWVDMADYTADPEAAANWQLFYNYDVLTDNESLATANKVLTEINDYTGAMFTVGASKTGGTTGYAVLNERIRLGIESLLSLGVPEDDELIVEAKKVLGDDDNVAENIMNRIKNIVYGTLTNPDNKMFEGKLNDETLEMEYPTYDMTVFVKNPNLYITKADRHDLSTDNAPGWTVIPGSGYDVSWTTGWSQVGNDKVPADAMMSNYNKDYVMYQEITDLPAGIYNVKAGFGERESETAAAGCFYYVVTTEADSTIIDAPVIGQSFPYDNLSADSLVIVDGKLTIGVSATAGSHTFFNEVKIELVAPAAGFDYAAGIDATLATGAKVRAIQLFDLNGRRITTARQGVVIVRKLMSDGSVKTEKIVIK